jgi:hypothetical protein
MWNAAFVEFKCQNLIVTSHVTSKWMDHTLPLWYCCVVPLQNVRRRCVSHTRLVVAEVGSMEPWEQKRHGSAMTTELARRSYRWLETNRRWR